MDKAKPVRLEDWTDIQELVAMSIGTDKGLWWADPSFGSELWILRQEGKVDDSTAGKVKTMILECTDWLKRDGIVKDITCEAKRLGKNEIGYAVTVLKPDGKNLLVKDVWNGIN